MFFKRKSFNLFRNIGNQHITEDELKERLTKAIARKLNDIINYIKDKKIDVNPVAFNYLGVIVDYLKKQEINKLINEIDDLINNNVDIFIIKYKIFNDLKTKEEKVECISKDEEELITLPDKIELLGSFDFNNTKCFAFVFSKDNFKIKGTLIGVSGGYPIDHIGSVTCGYTCSKFEELSEDWKYQAFELANFISEYWKNIT